jgi:threonine aldolase
MRQSGYLAAAGIYALDHHIDRLKKDHVRARQIAGILSEMPQLESIEPVETNIIIFSLSRHFEANTFLEQLDSIGVKALGFGGNSIRMVTHLEITDDMINMLNDRIKSIR